MSTWKRPPTRSSCAYRTDCGVYGEGADPLAARVTIGVVRGSTSDNASRDCIDALREYAPWAELVILEPYADEPLGRPYNCLLRITDSDYLVLMSDRYRVEATWLESLLSAMCHGRRL